MAFPHLNIYPKGISEIPQGYFRFQKHTSIKLSIHRGAPNIYSYNFPIKGLNERLDIFNGLQQHPATHKYVRA
jgi:hypothetical protein